MQVFEIAGYKSGIDRSGVNFLLPSDSFQNIENGYIYRQVLQSRKGFRQFSTGQLADGLRVMGIFTNYLRTGLKETLVFTTQHLYRYNVGTDTFDQVPIDGVTIVADWNIANNSHYITGTTYPFPDGSDRFVFTFKSANFIYQYNGTNISAYTNPASNPGYQDPSQGIITNAKHILYFGERLNFAYPQLGINPYPQGLLFSAIRTAAGGGEKYSGVGSAGAGLIILDTGAFISGASILGNTMCFNLSDSNWIIEKTQDAFNPYLPRKIPSVIGTNADYSFAQWGNQVMSIGNTGILITDGRVSNRSDDKIPFFTKDEIDNKYLQLTYGGFDRITSQFLFSYLDDKELNEDIESQDKVLTANYEEKTWSVYDMRFSVFGETDAGQEYPWDEIYEVNDPSWIAWDSTEDIWNEIGVEQSTYKTLAGDNNGFIWQLDQDFDDYISAITNIVAGDQTVITLGNPTPYRVGDKVSIEQVQGMTEINNFNPETNEVQTSPTYTIVAVGGLTSITIDVNSNPFTPYTQGGLVSKVIEFSAETIPFNPWRDQGRKVFVSFIEILIDIGTLGEVLLDVFSDEDDAAFIQDIRLKPQNNEGKREWVSISINQESNFITFAMKQSSPGSQLKIASFRIHCTPGALTSY